MSPREADDLVSGVSSDGVGVVESSSFKEGLLGWVGSVVFGKAEEVYASPIEHVPLTLEPFESVSCGNPYSENIKIY